MDNALCGRMHRQQKLSLAVQTLCTGWFAGHLWLTLAKACSTFSGLSTHSSSVGGVGVR